MAAPTSHVNISGTWKKINKMYVNVSGTWKEIKKAYVNVSGTWKRIHSRVALTRTFADFESLSTSGTSHTFTSVNFGTADADRHIVFGVHDFESVQTACTIGGVAATKLFGNNGGNFPVTWWMAAVPTGASGNVALTTNVARTVLRAAAYAVYGVPNFTPFDTASTGQVVNTTNSVSVDVEEGGLVFAGGGMAGAEGPNFSWSGITEDYDTATGTTTALSGASAEFSSAQTVNISVSLPGVGPGSTLSAMSLSPS